MARRLGILVVVVATLALGLAAENAAYARDDARQWLPDVLVGWTFILCGVVAWEARRARAMGVLLGATGVCWFLGNFWPDLLYLHRGPLVHLLLAYPGWRPRSRVDLLGIGAGYVAAVARPVWEDEAATIVLAAALVAVAAVGFARSTGRTRRDRGIALGAAGLVSAVVIGGAVARLAWGSAAAGEAALLAYEAALCASAVLLLLSRRAPAASAVADLVVELGETRAGSLRDRLAATLADPTLEVGYWSPLEDAYLDGGGAPLTLPAPASGRSTTAIALEGHPFAVLVHDAAVLGDPALVEAVASATRLAASNVALQHAVQAQVEELTRSRRQLLVAADRERRRLELRLREGPERRLDRLADALAELAPADDAATAERVGRARTQLDRTLDDLHELALGLHPRELATSGLAGALRSLSEHAPVPIHCTVGVGRLPEDVETTAYFVCAEGLANVTKYARASRVRLDVLERDGLLVVLVADDGVGGADPARGTGLQGLADRVEALGGRLRVTSGPDHGTSLAAEIPLGGEARSQAR